MVQQWLDRASEDIGVAEFLLDGAAGYPGPVVFHAQQAAEKYLKALLVHFQVEFRKTHDIVELLDLVGTVDRQLADSLVAAAVLTPYGVEVRYPGDCPMITLDDMRKAVRLARDVRDAVAARLSVPAGQGIESR
jgi:HEPN domain-containing protein